MGKYDEIRDSIDAEINRINRKKFESDPHNIGKEFHPKATYSLRKRIENAPKMTMEELEAICSND